MKRTLLIFFAAVTLMACQTTGSTPPTMADIAHRTCPPVQGVLYALSASPDISPETKAALSEAEPYITLVCANGSATAADLQALSAKAAPLLLKAITASNLSDGEKQGAIVAVVAAQVLIAERGAP